MARCQTTLYKLKQSYHRARRIGLIVDNYSVYKNRITARWLSADTKFALLFQNA